MKQRLREDGYLCIGLTKNKVQQKYQTHRLVAMAFINNHSRKEQVNHIDCNKTNNNVSNLEWCTPKENMLHAKENGLLVIHLENLNIKECKKVRQIDLKGNIINVFKSISEASRRTSIQATHIVKVCKDKNKTAGGYVWKYD